jgi:hypothetical protein
MTLFLSLSSIEYQPLLGGSLFFRKNRRLSTSYTNAWPMVLIKLKNHIRPIDHGSKKIEENRIQPIDHGGSKNMKNHIQPIHSTVLRKQKEPIK